MHLHSNLLFKKIMKKILYILVNNTTPIETNCEYQPIYVVLTYTCPVKQPPNYQLFSLLKKSTKNEKLAFLWPFYFLVYKKTRVAIEFFFSFGFQRICAFYGSEIPKYILIKNVYLWNLHLLSIIKMCIMLCPYV